MPKQNFSLTAQLREDLMDAYRDVYSRCLSQQEAWRKTATHSAPRYYVTPKCAWEKLRFMVRGDTSAVDKMERLRKQMYYDLFNKLQEMSQQKAFLGKSLWFICQFLVTQPAPQFYISTEALRKSLRLSKKYGNNYRHAEIYPKREG